MNIENIRVALLKIQVDAQNAESAEDMLHDVMAGIGDVLAMLPASIATYDEVTDDQC